MTAPDAGKTIGWFQRLRRGLARSSSALGDNLAHIFKASKLGPESLQEVEDVLIQADFGVETAAAIRDELASGRYDRNLGPEALSGLLAAEIARVLRPAECPLPYPEKDGNRENKPFVVLVVGVNGSGKTTTIGKLGGQAKRDGLSVMFAAGDTFRAAAIEQLGVWGERTGIPVISRPPGSNAAALAFDAHEQAQATQADVLFIDTAGRLHNKAGLMDELAKIIRVLKKRDETAPHAVLLVLDATTGQNALAQTEAFAKTAGVTGLVMTKLDGTARGGVLVAIARRFKLPIHAIGIGEGLEDLHPFSAEGFARAIAGVDEMDGQS